MKWGVVVFPGSNDDRDTLYALADVLGYGAEALWHGDATVKGVDAVVLPGGFSYGDYLRCGSIARFSPVMRAVRDHASAGGPVLGICNGFQILCEAGLLPGALVRNIQQRFLCETARVRVEATDTAFSCSLAHGQELTIPIKHGEGRYVATPEVLDRLEREGRVVFRYVDPAPNGAMHDIAGLVNETGNVVGLMPHPEHAVDAALALTDGRALFESAARWLGRDEDRRREQHA